MSKKSVWTASFKRYVTRRMLRAGRTNEEINNHLTKRCGSGISSADFAEMRKYMHKALSTKTKKQIGTKKRIIVKMLKARKTGDEINNYLISRFGSGASRDVLVGMRKELGLSRKMTKNSIPPEIRANPLSNGFNIAAKKLIQSMKQQGISTAIVSSTGTIKITQVQVTTFEVPNG